MIGDQLASLRLEFGHPGVEFGIEGVEFGDVLVGAVGECFAIEPGVNQCVGQALAHLDGDHGVEPQVRVAAADQLRELNDGHAIGLGLPEQIVERLLQITAIGDDQRCAAHGLGVGDRRPVAVGVRSGWDERREGTRGRST